MFKKVIIIGAGGHSKVIADIIEKSNDIVYGFLDDNLPQNTIIANNINWKVLGKIDMRYSLSITNSDLYFIIAIGNNYIRKEIADNSVQHLKYYNLVFVN